MIFNLKNSDKSRASKLEIKIKDSGTTAQWRQKSDYALFCCWTTPLFLTQTKFISIVVLVLSFIFFAPALFADGINFDPRNIPGFEPPMARKPFGSRLVKTGASILTIETKLVKDQQIINFEKRQITFMKIDEFNNTVWIYHYNELDRYMQEQQYYVFLDLWNKSISQRSFEVQKERDFSLEFKLPVEYPSWAQRFIGKEPPKLSIQGYETIIISYEHTSREEEGLLTKKNRPTHGFLFDQDYSFSINGSVGRLINVSINASKGDKFDVSDPLKDFKLEYKGEGNELEDEIVQEVVAGYTGFSMPGTQLSGYSQNKEGLFGIRINSRLGPVELTSILSNEKGEPDKITLGGSSGAGRYSSIGEKNYTKNKYFFLDKEYLKYYNRSYYGKIPTQIPPEVQSLELWRQINAYEKANPAPGEIIKKCRFYFADTAIVDKASLDTAWFKLIPPNKYWLDRKQGWIRLDSVRDIGDEVLLGIVLKTGTTYKNLSKPLLTSDSDTMPTLWILKNQNPEPTDTNFCLMWRNVYSFSADAFKDKDPKTFKLEVKLIQTGTEDKLTDENGNYYSDILGLTKDKGVPNIYNSKIFDQDAGDMIIPPIAFDPNNPKEDSMYALSANQPFINAALGIQNVNPDIYVKTGTDFLNIRDKFKIFMETQSKQTRFEGLWGIIDSSEIVKADGVVLERGKDYSVNYYTGELDLISPRAKAAQKVEVEYQRESFIPRNKVFLGQHAKFNLPTIGENSFVGASILYQSSSQSQDLTPQVGQEPYNRLLLDMNTKFNFSPEWMTDAVNAIPFIKTSSTSTASLELEIAHSLTSPNTNRQGDAYIDDFEATRISYSLGVNDQLWYKASPPYNISDSLYKYPPAWHWYWFTPVQGDEKNTVRKTDIWNLKLEKPLTQSENFESVLKLICKPFPLQAAPFREHYRNAWAAIMTAVPISFSDMREYEYLQIVVKPQKSHGFLHIDLGVISEDISINGGPPNGILNTEDTTWNYDNYRVEQDLGLDYLPDQKEYYLVASSDTTKKWDTLFYGDELLQEFKHDPHRDNFGDYRRENPGLAPARNGTQGNGSPLTSEDINYDGMFMKSSNEKFFRVTISLSDTSEASPYLVKTATLKEGWRLYRIPINSFGDSLIKAMANRGQPNWNEIRAVRLFWNGFDKGDSALRHTADTLTFAQIEFIGHQWQEYPATARKTPRVKVSAINTDEDSVYQPPPWVLIRKDESGNRVREQALQLEFASPSKGDTTLVKRLFTHNPLNLSSYDKILITYRGILDYSTKYDGKIKFLFRFGTHDSTYYEYSVTARGGDTTIIDNGKIRTIPKWFEEKIDLIRLSELKLAYLNEFNDNPKGMDVSDGNYAVRSKTSYAPSFSNIQWIAIGISVDTTVVNDTIRIWVNEFKVSGIKELNGWAGRASFSTQWADFMNISSSLEYYGADFRRMTETPLLASDARLLGTLNASWNMHKFFPAKWGLSIPMGAGISGSISRPKLKPNSDIFLQNNTGEADGISQMYKDAINALSGNLAADKLGLQDGITPSEYYERNTTTRNIFTRFDKTAPSANPLLQNTLDNTTIDFNYNYNATTEGKGKYPDGSKKLAEDTTHTYRSNIKYTLRPNSYPKWSQVKPIGSLNLDWMPKGIKDFQIDFLRGSIDLTLFDVTYSKSRKIERYINLDNRKRDFGLIHNLNASYDPVSMLGLDYNLDIRRRLDEAVWEVESKKDNEVLVTRWLSFINKRIIAMDPVFSKYGLLYEEYSRRQNAALDLNPKFFNWLSNSASYQSTFGQQREQRDTSAMLLNFDVTSRFSFNSSLNLDNLLGDFSAKTSKLEPVKYVFSAAEKSIDKIGLRDITFNYNASMTQINKAIDYAFLDSASKTKPIDLIKYQLGIKDRSIWDIFLGDYGAGGDDKALGGMRRRSGYKPNLQLNKNDSRSVNRSFTVSTGINLGEPLPVSLNGDLRNEISFLVKPDTTVRETTITFPQISLYASSPLLNKIDLITAHITNTRLSSKYNFTKREQKNITVRNALVDPNITTTRTNSFTPFLGITGTLKKWPVSFNTNHNYERSTTSNSKNLGADTTNKFSGDFSASYQVSKSNFRSDVKIWRWTVPLKGSLTVDGKGDYSISKTIKMTSDRPSESKHYSFSPTAAYDFTSNIRGTASYKATTSNIENKKSSSHLFRIEVKISFN